MEAKCQGMWGSGGSSEMAFSQMELGNTTEKKQAFELSLEM